MKRGRKPSLLPPAESSLMSLDLPPNFHSGSPTPLYSKDARKIINASLKGLLMGELNATKVGDREEGGVAWKIYPSRSSLVLARLLAAESRVLFFFRGKEEICPRERTNKDRKRKKFLRGGEGKKRFHAVESARFDIIVLHSSSNRRSLIARKIEWRFGLERGGWQRGAIEDSDRGWWRRRGVLGWKLPRSPAGDLELVIKYKEPCLASSRMESARLFPFRLPSRLLASPFRYARNTERAVFNSRLHSIYFESRIRRCRTWSERPSDAISAIAEKSHPTSAHFFARFASRRFSKKRSYRYRPIDAPEI